MNGAGEVYHLFEAIPRQYYRAIVADPPWAYRNKKTGGSMRSGSAAKYHTLSIDELKAIPVSDIAVKDSILFLWVTTPLLPDGLDLLRAWGYRYKTAVFWNKIRYGMGFWFRGQVEPCLIGIRGKVPAFRSSARNLFAEKARQHSEKPDAFWDLIEPCLDEAGISPRIEMFARSRRRGWDSFGDQIQVRPAEDMEGLANLVEERVQV